MSYKWAPKRNWNVKSPIPTVSREPDVFSVSDRETSPLTSFPAEILNIIGQFLSVEDLLSCSATCVRLRAVFNDNVIWKRFCKQNILSYIENAKLNQTYLLPSKFDVDSLTYNLEELCEKRVQYINQNQLLHNWKNGRYVERTVHSTTGLYYMSLKSGTPIIYDNIYLFLYDFYAHNIVVWNIEDIPFPYTSIKLLFYNYFYEGLHFEVAGKKLVVLEVGKLIQVYDINLPDKSLPLVHIILVDNDEPLHSIPEFHNPEDMYAICYHRIIGNRTYSHKVGKPILHVWDIEVGEKIKALQPPKHGCDFDLLSASDNGDDLVLCLKINDSQRQFNALGIIYEVFTYNFPRDFFRTFWTNKEDSSCTYIPFHAVQHAELVILFCRLHDYFAEDGSLPRTVLILYDLKWAMIIGEKSFPELVCHRQTRIVNNQLLLATAFCLYILDLQSQEVVYSFKYDDGNIELLNVFDSNFLITTPKSIVSVSKTKRKEIWDIKKRNKCVRVSYMFTSPYSKDSVFVNQSFTKLIVVGKGTLGILHFW